METLIKDIRYGIRGLLKRPGFTAVAVVTLALGIGANTTLFSFVNGILLRPLPYKDPAALVALDETAPKQGIESFAVSFPNFLDWRQQNTVFEDIGVYQAASYSLAGAGDPEQIPGARISHGNLKVGNVDRLPCVSIQSFVSHGSGNTDNRVPRFIALGRTKTDAFS